MADGSSLIYTAILSPIHSTLELGAHSYMNTMTKTSLSTTLAIAIAALVGFVGGYLFHFKFGQELPAARQALIEQEVSRRVLDAYLEIVQAHATHKTLTSVKSIEEMTVLQGRSKLAVLATIDRFSQVASEAEDRRERLFAQVMLPSALKLRDEINAEP